MLSNIDAWIKANPYVSKLVVGILTAVLGWFTHKYTGTPLVVEKPAPPPHTTKHVYGWLPASPEHQAAVRAEVGGVTIRKPALKTGAVTKHEINGTGPVLDQGQLGSCGPNALASLLYKAGAGFDASRLFTYYQTRVLMGTVYQDSGVINSTMVRAVNRTGFVDERLWPYDIRRFKVKPSASVVSTAAKRKGVKFAAVDVDVDAIKAAVGQDLPVLIGVDVFESFESDAVDKTGLVPMPSAFEQKLGGHDIVIVGFDDARRLFKFKNSWSTGWGDQGFGYFPYEYVTTYGSDFWAVMSLK